jgi:DNA (cytosine-5)-methyltransferase 1
LTITFIDLFAGIGGFRIALEKAGAKCVFSSEIDKFALQIYKANFDEDASGDITKVSEEDIPTHDVLCAGFPCQSFSTVGKRKGFSDPRGTLFFDILRIAKHHRPKVLLLENVKGLIGHNKGDTFETIKNGLDDLGYQVHWKVLSATMFGLPQRRERLFIVAIRKDIDKPFTFPTGTTTKKRLRDIVERHVDAKHFLSENRNNFIVNKRASGDCRYGYHLIGPDEYVYCLLTSKYEHNLIIDNSKPTGVFHNIKAKKAGDNVINKQNVRRLTPKEYGRLQGFPDDFKVPVVNKHAYRLFGNAVAVPVVEALYTEIQKVL